MELPTVPNFEEHTYCGHCKQKFTKTDKNSGILLNCKHNVCLQCTCLHLSQGMELFCCQCWKHTELQEVQVVCPSVLSLTKNFKQLKMQNDTAANDVNHQERISSGLEQQSSLQMNNGPTGTMISENCHTHAMPLALWCHTCCAPVCRACATSDHAVHQIKSHNEAKEHIINEVQCDLVNMNKMLNEIQILSMQQREFLLKILESCATLKTHVEADLNANGAHFEVGLTKDMLTKLRSTMAISDNLIDIHSLYNNVIIEKQRLQIRYQEMYVQNQVDTLIRNSTLPFDLKFLTDVMNRLVNPNQSIIQANNNNNNTSHLMQQSSHDNSYQQQSPILLLANYCMSQLYSNHMLNNKQHQVTSANDTNHIGYSFSNADYTKQLIFNNENSPRNMPNHIIVSPGLMRGSFTNICPLYYFSLDVNGSNIGRIVIEVRSDVAPRMAKNFEILTMGEVGVGYKGCQVFQCWEGESVITGDFELNNGRGGRSIFEDSYFLPDDTKLLATRGTVGMRRTQKRHDNLGMVGSQFRIILQEMRGFTGIFGYVIEGLDLIEKISTYGDTTGKPTKNILIGKCGKLQ